MIQIAKSNIPLAAGGLWDVGWQLNQSAEGEALVVVSAYADQVGTLQIIQSDDGTNPAMTIPSGDSVSVQPYKVATIQVAITHAYWQAVLVNGPVAQAVFEGIAWQSNSLDAAILLELKKLRFAIENQADNLAKQVADGQPVGSF